MNWNRLCYLFYALFCVESLSADASSNGWILFNSGRFDIYQNITLNAIAPDGSNRTTLFNGALIYPKSSRDGRTILFSVPEMGCLPIYRFSTDGVTPPVRITPYFGLMGDATFSPDNTWIAYFVSVPQGGGEVTPTATAAPESSMKTLPLEGKRAILPQVINLGGYLAMARTDGSDAGLPTPIELPGQQRGYTWAHPDWHPFDFNRIAVTFMDALPSHPDFTIYITNPQATSIQPLLRPVMTWSVIERDRSPAWSPDGQYLAYVRQIGNEYAIYVVRGDGSDAPGTQITPSNLAAQSLYLILDGIRELCWSPDGTSLAFCVYTHPTYPLPLGFDIFTVRRDGSGLTRLTNDGMNDFPDWYPLPSLPSIFVGGAAPTVQPTPTPVSPPVQTATPLPPTPVPVPTVPPVPTSPPQQWPIVYEFNESSVEANGWTIIPGGFSGAEAGTIAPVEFSGNQIPSSRDKKGLAISVAPGQVAFAHASKPIHTAGKPVVLRLTVRADAPDASVALAALRSSMAETDWSIAVHMPVSAAGFVERERSLVLVYQPDAGELVTPIIQVAAAGRARTVTVLVDKLEAIILENQNYGGEVFHSTPQ